MLHSRRTLGMLPALPNRARRGKKNARNVVRWRSRLSFSVFSLVLALSPLSLSSHSLVSSSLPSFVRPDTLARQQQVYFPGLPPRLASLLVQPCTLLSSPSIGFSVLPSTEADQQPSCTANARSRPLAYPPLSFLSLQKFVPHLHLQRPPARASSTSFWGPRRNSD